MAIRNEDRLAEAWRALDVSKTATGWNSIPLCSVDTAAILAGRHYPENLESLIICVRDRKLTVRDRIAECKGFTIETPTLEINGVAYRGLAITRRTSACLDLFTAMASDLVSIAQTDTASEEQTVCAILDRVAAWQRFMSRNDDGILKGEEEVGMMGELHFLLALLQTGIPAELAIDGWRGPLDGLHDFVFSAAEIEVKTCTRATGFVASVSCLDQLDETLCGRLFLSAVCILLSESGISLPELVSTVEARLPDTSIELDVFRRRVLIGGYHKHLAEHYHRRFTLERIALLEVGPSLPHLSRRHVPAQVAEANYRLELDLTGQQLRPISTLITLLT